MVREKLEEARNTLLGIDTLHQSPNQVRRTCDKAYGLIDEALASLPEWVSVKERLPEWGVKEHLLVALTDRHTKEPRVGEGWWIKTNWEDYWPPDAIVTHWMPIPIHPTVKEEA